MKNISHKQNSHKDTKRQIALGFAALVLLVVAGVCAFLRFYNNYDDELLYAERLNQMREVTEQLFSGLEDIINVQWENAKYQCNYLEKNIPTTVDELLKVMQDQTDMWELDEKQSDVIAIDAQGRYYYPSGKQGLMYDMSYLDGKPEKVSYVFNEMTTSRTRMMFLYRLDEPVVIQDGEKTAQILYYGLAEDMELLNPYFDCEAYDSNNSTYVVDTQGLKLFSGSNNNKDLLDGFNIFSMLREMNYLHDFSFDDTLKTLQKKGLAYSNAILNGEEYYYALYQMDNSEWILLFLVPSSYVATNTVQLVNTTTKLLLAFAVFMTLVCVVMIYIVLRIQQKKALRIAGETNAMLEANNRKLEMAQAATTEALQVAKAASKAKTDFLSNMSHDIRTPMNAIVGITRLMAHDKNDPAKIETYIEKIQQSSQYLLSLINDVLDMSKIESGEVTLNKEPIGITDQIEQVESIVHPQIEERMQKFEVRTHNITHEYLTGDAVRLRQVLINLLSNAIKYTPCGGCICLDLEEIPCEISDQAKLRISVTDSGCGMTPEFMEHIFEPFTRAENSTTNRVQGTGLGMAITKNIVDLAGGTISVQSEVNKGSCFTVELPFMIDRTVRNLNSKPANAAAEVGTVLKGMRFMCAEDNALNAEILQAILDMNGAKCVIYPDGQKLVDAFDFVKPGDFDAILMDVQMPVMNGLDATRAIRRSRNPLGRTIPIIAMTANAFSEDVQNCLNAGMNAHVSKPIDFAVLERTLKSVLADA